MSPKAVTEPAAEPVPAVRAELFGPGRRATTVGLVLLTFVTAFEAMGVGTAMPAVIDDLGAVSAYAWPFAAFLAASVLGTVLGGRWCDVAGPRAALARLPAGLRRRAAGRGNREHPRAPARRAGAAGGERGAQFVAVFVTIAAVYPERARPAVFGLMSSAWVLPSLVGPPLAGFVTDRFSWHWVFLGLVPVVGVALALVVPAVRRLGVGPPGRRGRTAPGRRPAP